MCIRDSLLPVSLRSADENEIVVDSFFENRTIPGSQVRAVEFGSQNWTPSLDFSDAGWLKTGNAKLRGKKFRLKKGGVIGHPSLMGCGGFEFEVDWPANKYGVVKVQCCRSLNEKGEVKSPEAQTFSIMLYGQQFYVAALKDGQNPGQNVRQKKGKSVPFKIGVEKNKLVVYAYGKKCFSEKIGEAFGRCVSFSVEDRWNTVSYTHLTLPTNREV